MLVFALGLGLTAVLVAKLAHWHGLRPAADLGSMSNQWVHAYQASQPASSM
jgi:hypothetical protein